MNLPFLPNCLIIFATTITAHDLMTGEIYWTIFSGSEISKIRPAVIVQRDDAIENCNLIVPLASDTSTRPIEELTPAVHLLRIWPRDKLNRRSVLLVDQVVCADKRRIDPNDDGLLTQLDVYELAVVTSGIRRTLSEIQIDGSTNVSFPFLAGQVYEAFLDPAHGCEIAGAKPIAILQRNDLTEVQGTFLAAPMEVDRGDTYFIEKVLGKLPRILLPSFGRCVLRLDQIRALSKDRLTNPDTVITTLTAHELTIALEYTKKIPQANRFKKINDTTTTPIHLQSEPLDRSINEVEEGNEYSISGFFEFIIVKFIPFTLACFLN